MKRTNWPVARVTAAMWDGVGRTWMRGTNEEMKDGGDHYVQMTDDTVVRFAVGDPKGDSVWVEWHRHDGGSTLTVWHNGPDGEVLFTQDFPEGKGEAQLPDRGEKAVA